VVWPGGAAAAREPGRWRSCSTVDALTGAVIATLLATGTPLVHPDTGTVMLLGRMSIVYPGVCSPGLPFGEALPARTRRLGLAITVLGVGLTLHPATRMAMVMFAPVRSSRPSWRQPHRHAQAPPPLRRPRRSPRAGAGRGRDPVPLAFEMGATAILPHVWLPAFPAAIYLDFTTARPDDLRGPGLRHHSSTSCSACAACWSTSRCWGRRPVVALFGVSAITGMVLGGSAAPVVQNPL
jgi:hypothetical protein